MKTLLIIASLLLFLASNAHAAKQAQCSIINHQPGKLTVLTTRMFHATHIQLPENLLTPPIVGNDDLWNVAGKPGSNHIFIQPNSETDQGQSTTLTAIGESNQAYSFLVNRVAGHSEYCITVRSSGAFYRENSPFSNYQSPAERRASSLALENSNLKDQVNRTDDRVDVAIKKYQQSIYTNYSWRSFGRSSLTKGLVTSVLDDGRFTKIRLRGVPFGVPIFSAKIDGKEQIIEASFDSAFNTYTISGLYPQLIMKVDKRSGIKIKRDDFSTNYHKTNKTGLN